MLLALNCTRFVRPKFIKQVASPYDGTLPATQRLSCLLESVIFGERDLEEAEDVFLNSIRFAPYSSQSKTSKSHKIIVLSPGSEVSPEEYANIKRRFPRFDFSQDYTLKPGDGLFCTPKAMNLKRKAILRTLQTGGTIWCVRGGYGSARFLQDLPENLPNSGVIIGCSDITALLTYTATKYGWKNVHGAVLRDAIQNKDPTNITEVEKYLKYGIVPEIDGLIPLNEAASNTNSINATLTGGNLTIVQASIGTFWQINAEDKILMLEEVEEPAYKVDRMLTHLKQSGMLIGCKAIVFGEFITGYHSAADIHAVLKDFAKSLNIPVFKTNKFGHGKRNIPFIYNRQYQLNKKDSGFSLK